MRTGSLPYRWFWAIGGLNLLIGVLMMSSGQLVGAVGVGFGGAVLVALGFVERHRGAPRA